MPGTFDHDGVAVVHARDAHPVDAVGQWLEQRELLGRERVGHAVQPGAREDLHVLAVAAPEPDATFTGHVAVAVDAERRLARQDLVDADAIAFLHAEIGVGRELDHPSDRLVAGDDGEHARTGDQLDAFVGREIAAAEATGLDAEHRATGRRIGDRELAHLVLLVPEEDNGTAGVHAGEYVRAHPLPAPEALGFGGREGWERSRSCASVQLGERRSGGDGRDGRAVLRPGGVRRQSDRLGNRCRVRIHEAIIRLPPEIPVRAV